MWGVPVDHKVFNEISGPQWLWYFFNYAKDQEDEFDTNRNFIEYHASFIEPAAVRKIREARESTVAVSDGDFASSIKGIFGRDINFDEESSGKRGISTVTANLEEALDNLDGKDDFTNNDILKSKFWDSLE